MREGVEWIRDKRHNSSVLLFGTVDKIFDDCYNRSVSSAEINNLIVVLRAEVSWPRLRFCGRGKMDPNVFPGWKNVSINLLHKKTNFAFQWSSLGFSAWVRSEVVNCPCTHVLIQGLSISTSSIKRKLLARKIKLRPSAFFQLFCSKQPRSFSRVVSEPHGLLKVNKND